MNVLFGSSGGLTSVNDRLLSGSGGKYGTALAAGNFNGDQVSGIDCDDLIIAAPYETVSTATNAGSIYRWAGGTTGLATTVSQTLNQDVTGILDTAETGDYFGWRLAVTQADADAYDDLLVAVPGDACTSSVGTGRQILHGSSTGITVTGNEIGCDTYGCSILEDRILGCHSGSAPVYGTAASEVLALGLSNGIIWGADGNDDIHGDHGNDLLFGGVGDDTIEGGPGRDIIIAGSGDDTVVINLDCMVMEGEVVDGGPGSDTIRSHLSSTELGTLGLTMVSIENFVVIPEDPDGTDVCVPGPNDDGPTLRPRVSVSWSSLATPDAVLTTTTGGVTLLLKNTSADIVLAELEFVLRVRGEEIRIEDGPVTVAANSSATYTLDLNDFIPLGLNTSLVNPALLLLPSSASISASALLSVGGNDVGHSFPPTIFGHLETSTSGPSVTTAVLYREGALHDTYHHGDLARWRANAPAYIGSARLMGRGEAHGSLGIPGY